MPNPPRHGFRLLGWGRVLTAVGLGAGSLLITAAPLLCTFVSCASISDLVPWYLSSPLSLGIGLGTAGLLGVALTLPASVRGRVVTIMLGPVLTLGGFLLPYVGYLSSLVGVTSTSGPLAWLLIFGSALAVFLLGSSFARHRDRSLRLRALGMAVERRDANRLSSGNPQLEAE